MEHPDGVAVLEFAAAAGVTLDPWQDQRILRKSLLQRDGRWAAFEVVVCVPRQNGKNAVLEVRELAGPLILGERLVIHSAHLADTSKEAFRRIELILEANEWLSREVRHIWRTNGHEAIEFMDGARIRFRTRTKGGGRGFSGDFIAFDEAMIFPEASLGAIMPVVSAQPNPQLWYTGSAVDQTIHEDGIVFARLRARGIEGADPDLAYFEWSVPGDSPDEIDDAMAEDPDAWAQANPALGIRISADYVAKEQRSMGARTFAVERLGVGDWPITDGSADSVIPAEAWDKLADHGSQIVGSVVFAFDVSPDRSWATIAAAGRRKDGLGHVEVADRRPGTGWVPARLAELKRDHDARAFICDGATTSSLLPEIASLKVDVTQVKAPELGAGCGLLFDDVRDEKLRHLGTPELRQAIRGATARPLGESWAWGRKASAVDITPLVACTLAYWGLETAPPKREFMVAWA